jgi:hypothetical protein
MILNTTSDFTPDYVIGESWLYYFFFRYPYAVLAGNAFWLCGFVLSVAHANLPLFLVTGFCIVGSLFVVGLVAEYKYPRHTTLWKFSENFSCFPLDWTANVKKAFSGVCKDIYNCRGHVSDFCCFWVQLVTLFASLFLASFGWIVFLILRGVALFHGFFARNPVTAFRSGRNVMGTAYDRSFYGFPARRTRSGKEIIYIGNLEKMHAQYRHFAKKALDFAYPNAAHRLPDLDFIGFMEALNFEPTGEKTEDESQALINHEMFEQALGKRRAEEEQAEQPSSKRVSLSTGDAPAAAAAAPTAGVSPAAAAAAPAAGGVAST